MSIVWECDEGCLMNHNQYIFEAYHRKHQLHPTLFDTQRPYKTSKSNKPVFLDPPVSRVKKKYERLRNMIVKEKLFREKSEDDGDFTKRFADECVAQTLPLRNMNDVNGGNTSEEIVYPRIANCDLVIPEFCKFVCGDVRITLPKLEENDFDAIIVDPPWWNKYIRRKSTKDPSDSYSMLYNQEIADLPIGNLLSTNGIVAVWCTNCANHENDIKTLMFPAWNVSYVATWIWMKVTISGEPICPFSKLNGKQPFEKLILGLRNGESSTIKPEDEKMFISTPSVLHSHKPPLNDLLKKYFTNDKPKFLEIFARYLLPHTTSAGSEPLRWQHTFLYTKE